MAARMQRSGGSAPDQGYCQLGELTVDPRLLEIAKRDQEDRGRWTRKNLAQAYQAAERLDLEAMADYLDIAEEYAGQTIWYAREKLAGLVQEATENRRIALAVVASYKAANP